VAAQKLAFPREGDKRHTTNSKGVRYEYVFRDGKWVNQNPSALVRTPRAASELATTGKKKSRAGSKADKGEVVTGEVAEEEASDADPILVAAQKLAFPREGDKRHTTNSKGVRYEYVFRDGKWVNQNPSALVRTPRAASEKNLATTGNKKSRAGSKADRSAEKTGMKTKTRKGKPSSEQEKPKPEPLSTRRSKEGSTRKVVGKAGKVYVYECRGGKWVNQNRLRDAAAIADGGDEEIEDASEKDVAAAAEAGGPGIEKADADGKQDEGEDSLDKERR